MRKYQTKGNSLILLDLWECGLFEVSDFITLNVRKRTVDLTSLGYDFANSKERSVA